MAESQALPRRHCQSLPHALSYNRRLTGEAGRKSIPDSPCSTSSGGAAALQQVLHPAQQTQRLLAGTCDLRHRNSRLGLSQTLSSRAWSSCATTMLYLAFALLRYPFPEKTSIGPAEKQEGEMVPQTLILKAGCHIFLLMVCQTDIFTPVSIGISQSAVVQMR